MVAVTTTTALFWWYFSNNPIHNDSATRPPSSRLKLASSEHVNSTGVDEDGALCPVVWGSNKSNIIGLQSPEVETFQIPVNVRWLENTALRDLALHEKHAACVDIRGDVFQWGDGFCATKSDTKAPKATLCNKNIIKLQLTDSHVYALSASGRIYVFSANKEQQKLSNRPTLSTAPWQVFSCLGWERQNIDFVEILAKEKLNWGEAFVSIAAGRNHLLALTSKGRTFTHPVNKDANSHGQLGLQKIEIPTPSRSLDAANHSHITVELVPRSAAGSNIDTSLSSRKSTPTSVESEHLSTFDESLIRYCDALYEIPSLRGVKVSQIAAGDRNSFVNTNSGRVLGWGANEHGQIGLGSGMTLDTITVPTEIYLNRNVPTCTRSRCLNVIAGGDLTCFIAERNARDSVTHIDILSCGNGQWGGLGNNSFSTFQGDPVRVKNISGLHEFNDREQRSSPIIPHAISVSPTGHVLLTLDTQLHAGAGGSGRDLLVWGLNHDYQLGTGKRSSVNTPTILERPEGGRFMLAKRKATVKDLLGRVWKKDVEVEQCAIAGYGNSVVYWKIK